MMAKSAFEAVMDASEQLMKQKDAKIAELEKQIEKLLVAWCEWKDQEESKATKIAALEKRVKILEMTLERIAKAERNEWEKEQALEALTESKREGGEKNDG